MCDQAERPSSVAEALTMLERALDHLNAADAASLPATVQAEALRVLERAGAKHTAARARVLTAFAGQAAYEDDGQGSARTWLRWQTRVTKGAAAGAVGWVRRLTAHPVIGTALATGNLSESWARQICDWTGQLPLALQDDADQILVGAACSGVDLDGLAGLAQEMFERSRQDRAGPDDRFGDRYFRLGVTFRGAGRAEGDLTPGCAAALDTVLEALAKKAGPEDRRTADQRRHDALQEACQRLISAEMLPGRARQPAQVYLHMTLSQLRDAPGASEVEAAWAAARAAQPGWLTGAEADAIACDSRLAPVVTGFIDWQALDRMTGFYLATHGLPPGKPAEPTTGSFGQDQTPGHNKTPSAAQGKATGDGQTPLQGEAAGQGGTVQPTGPAPPPATQPTGPAPPPATQPTGPAPPPATQPTGPLTTPALRASQTPAPAQLPACGCTCGRCTCPGRTPLSPGAVARLRQTMLHLAADVLSGPTGLAATLRTAQHPTGPEGSRSLPLTIPIPLDTGQAKATIPAQLHRAVVTRHTHCCFPGCRIAASECDIHHVIPRSRGGPTALWNLAPACQFHHLTVIHLWGWTLRLHPDGTTTAVSPHGRTLHDHDPSAHAA
jgi:hypothetical protein